MQKTVREWGEELLPEPYKSQFMANLDNPDYKPRPDRVVEKELCIFSAFTWNYTPEEAAYWESVHLWVIGEGNLPTHTPTECQTAEALLKEYEEFCRDNYRLEISDRIKQDFLTSKYGKG